MSILRAAKCLAQQRFHGDIYAIPCETEIDQTAMIFGGYYHTPVPEEYLKDQWHPHLEEIEGLSFQYMLRVANHSRTHQDGHPALDNESAKIK